MTVLVCGGSFLMRRSCLTHRLYSDRSPYTLLFLHLQPFFLCVCVFLSHYAVVFSPIPSHFSKSQVESNLCEQWICPCMLPHPSLHGNTRIVHSSLNTASFIASFPLEANRRLEKYDGHLFDRVSGDKVNTVMMWVVYSRCV